MMYTDDAWEVIINYTTPSDVLNREIDELEIYDRFADDVFNKARSMAINNFEELKQKAQENEE